MATPDKNDGAQEASGIRAGFLLNTFLCPSKEKYFALGCENPIKNNLRGSNTLNKYTIHGFWIPATSMDGESAAEDMESSPPIHAGMTAFKNSPD